jgi:hypothetical protein
MVLPAASSHKTTKPLVLNSWKEIASYLGRGVRTVQRYERDFRLPVRRLPGKVRGAVIAFPQDLDSWLRDTPVDDLPVKAKLRTAAILTETRACIGQGVDLRLRCHELRQAHSQAIHELVQNLTGLVRLVVTADENSPKKDSSQAALRQAS